MSVGKHESSQLTSLFQEGTLFLFYFFHGHLMKLATFIENLNLKETFQWIFCHYQLQ